MNLSLTQKDLQTYSRQLNQSTMSEKELLKVFGIKPLVIGVSSTGSEVVKNLVKNGVKHIYLHDESQIEEKDLRNICYFFPNDIGSQKADALKKYNQDIKILSRQEINSDQIRAQKIDCIVVTSILEWDFLVQLNDIAIECKIPFVFGCVLGFSFFVFSCFPQDQVENNNEIQDQQHSHFEKYFSNKTKMDQVFNLQTYNELHQETFALLCSIFAYLKKHGKFPNQLNQKDSKDFYSNLQSMAQDFEVQLRFSKELYCKYFAQLRQEISPVAQVCGGITATEILKTVIQRLRPLNQVIFYENILQVQNSKIYDQELIMKRKGQFFDLEMLVGEQLVDDIANLKVLLVGCGAVGCEQVKNIYSVGACRGQKGHLYLVDNDLIEASNIPRQVCFSEDDIKKNKAKACQNWLLQKDSQTQVTSFEILLCKENEHIFNDEFFQNIDLIILAVDSILARDYIANKAVKHKKFLIETGTYGFESQSQSQIPFLSKKIDISQQQEISTASCTVKSNLKSQGDSLVYSKTIFASEFSQVRTDDGNFLKNNTLNNLMEMYSKKDNNLEFCLQVLRLHAEEIFNKMFYDDILEIGKDYNPFKYDQTNSDHKELVDSLCHLLNLSLTQFCLKSSDNNQISIQNPSQILPIFDKDDIFHASIVYQISKLRSLAFNINYSLERYEAVGKIGNIVPAIIQSTSVASGFAFLEIITWLINKEKIIDLYQELVQENRIAKSQFYINHKDNNEKPNPIRNDLFLSEEKIEEFQNKFYSFGFYETFGKLSDPDSLNRSMIQFEISYLNSFDLNIKVETCLSELITSINLILASNNLPEAYFIEFQDQIIYINYKQSISSLYEPLRQPLQDYLQKGFYQTILGISKDFSKQNICNLVIYNSKQVRTLLHKGDRISEIQISFN
ncbi:hypothetical protein ABPG72_002722 [Tetrahymena utriculariae]